MTDTATRNRTRANGEGSVYLVDRRNPNGPWRARLALRDSDGAVVSHVTRQARNASGARRALAELEAENPDGLYVPKAPRLDPTGRRSIPGTVGALLDEWTAETANTVQGSTADNYGTQVKRIRAALGDTEVTALTVPIVSNFLRTMMTTREGTPRPLSQSSKNLVRKVLAMSLDYAIQHHGLTLNVARLVEAPRRTVEERDRLPRWLEEDEAVRFLAAAQADRLAAAWVLQLQLGLRGGEVRALAWSDVDFRRRLLHIRHGQQRNGSDVVARGNTKNPMSVRDLRFSPEVAAILKAHKKRQDTERKRFEDQSAWTEFDLIFTNEDGSLIRPETYRRQFAKVCEASNIVDATPHALRHSCATHMIMRGKLLTDIARLMGHANLVMLTTLYVHLRPGVVEGHEDALTDMLATV